MSPLCVMPCSAPPKHSCPLSYFPTFLRSPEHLPSSSALRLNVFELSKDLVLLVCLSGVSRNVEDDEVGQK